MEQIIKFPLPEYIKIFDNLSDLKIRPECLCYQYNLDIYKNGPYGFNTTLSKKMLEFVFGDLKIWDSQKLVVLDSYVKRKEKLFFYSNTNKVEEFILEVNKYNLQKKKNDYFIKSNKEIFNLPKYPLFLDILDENQNFKSKTINKLIELGISFVIRQNYMPEAGDTFLIFENNIFEKVKVFSKNEKIDFLEFETIDNLKPW